MKCTQCGCTEFVTAKRLFADVDAEGRNIEGPVQVKDFSEVKLGKILSSVVKNGWGYDTSKKLEESGTITAYVCKKCGHIEFFCKTYILEEQERQAQLEEAKRIEEVNNRIQSEIDAVLKKIDALKIEAKDENITVKKQKELLNEIEVLKDKVEELKKEIQ